MRRFGLWLLAMAPAALVSVACGGQVQGAGSPSMAGSAGSGGATPPASGSGGGGAAGPSGASGGGDPVSPVPGSGGSGGGGPIGSAGAGPGTCQLPWWGTSLAGVTGLTSCPASPSNPALLAYGSTEFDSCQVIRGPAQTKYDGENLSCCYTFDESACGGGSGPGCFDVWYFGDGTGQTTIPTTSVTAQLASCSLPFGKPIVLSTQTQRADHLIGVWVKCRGNDPLGSPFIGDGFIFRADGTFHTLQTDSSGHLVETTGCNQFGLWGFISSSSAEQAQVNVAFDAGYQMATPRFVDGAPRQLQLQWDGGNLDTYIAVQ